MIISNTFMLMSSVRVGATVSAWCGMCGPLMRDKEERWHEPRGAAVRCGAAVAGPAGGQRRAAFVELPRADRARRPDRRRACAPAVSARRPGAAEPGKLRRVRRAAVRLLGRRAVRGAGQCAAASARGRVHRRQFRGAAAGRDAGPGRGAGAARRRGRHAGRGDLDPHRRIRPAAQSRAAASRAGQPRPTGPGCSTPPARPDGRKARC